MQNCNFESVCEFNYVSYIIYMNFLCERLCISVENDFLQIFKKQPECKWKVKSGSAFISNNISQMQFWKE